MTALVSAACALLVGAIVWALSRTEGRWRVVPVLGGAAVLAAGGWILLGPHTEGVWVDSLGALDGKVSFSAPQASGHATGDTFFFTSSASEDAVFEAFLDAYPEATRDGDVATLTVGVQAFTLTFHPEGIEGVSSDPCYLLANAEAILG
ncbi:hypothetical protein [Demequina salsinemoris]|uniref:hypothetical protein n=1 Tax=Demequina salsinemoris TaxID=577470 RepID=UPI00128CA807|nr:hypothetical protein [Demequina salsinemoris]